MGLDHSLESGTIMEIAQSSRNKFCLVGKAVGSGHELGGRVVGGND